MRLEDAIARITFSLESVHVESAAARIEEKQAANQAKQSGAALILASDAEVWRAGVHESAHAVAAVRCDLHLEHAGVRCDASGWCCYYEGGESIDQTISRVVADLAGPCAELLLVGADDARCGQLAHSSDLLLARLNIDRCRARAPTWQLPTRLFAQLACSIVATNIDSIGRLAHVLILYGQLSRDAVAALVRQ